MNNKKIGKKIISFTVNKEFFVEWKKYIEKESINSSNLIEKLLQGHLEKKGGENEKR